MKRLNRSTYQSEFQAEPIVAEIGDVKQAKFYPRVKLTKWDNEANFSLGLDLSPKGTHSISKDGVITYVDGDTSARFYNLVNAGEVPLTSIRRVAKHGHWTALEAAAQYEMFNNIGKPGEMLLAKYTTTEPAMAAFDNMPVDSHMDLDVRGNVKDFNYPDKSSYGASDIPMSSFDSLKLVRFLTPYTPMVNPMFMDAGLVQMIVQWHGSELNEEQVANLQMDAVEHVMNKHGYPTERHPFRAKLYVRHGDRLVKFFSGQPDKGGLYSYVNLKCNYNKAYDFYKPEVFKDIRDNYAYGLQYVYPEIQDGIVDEMMDEFAKRLKVPIKDQPLNKDETAHWQTIQKLHNKHDWIANAKRSDANWVRLDPKDGLEFEVVLAKKPRTNQVKLTTNLPKNVTAYYQAELSFEEMAKNNTDRPLDVMKSLAIYHSAKMNNQYKTGKLSHIYRPMAWDSAGLKVWCDFKELEGLSEGQEYDLSKGLTIEVPQHFIDTAQYPITVDPTFGYTTAGVTQGGFGAIGGTKYRGADGTVDSVVVYSNTSGADAFNVAIYNTDSTLLKAGTAQTPAAQTNWITFTGFASQQVRNKDYYLVGWSHITTSTYSSTLNYGYYDAVTSAVAVAQGGTYGTFPDPATFTVSYWYKWSIYANITSTTNIYVADRVGVKEQLTLAGWGKRQFSNGYQYRRKLTIDSTKVSPTGHSTLTSFPVAISGTYTYLKTIAYSGLINSSSGYDIRFEDSNGSKLDYELESYVATSGAFNAWVRIPSLPWSSDNSADTVIYMYYSNINVTDNREQNRAGVWDSDYTGVYHLADGTTLSLTDSSTYSPNTFTNSGSATAATGQIGGGIGLNSSQSAYGAHIITAATTISAWIKGTGFANPYNGIVTNTQASNSVYAYMTVKSTSKLRMQVKTGTGSTTIYYDGTGSNTLSTGTWYYIVLTYSSSAGLTGYVNGASDATAAANGEILPRVNGAAYIGYDTINGGNFYGTIDEVHFSSVVRSADWVKTEYNNQSSPSTFYAVANEEWAISHLIEEVRVTESVGPMIESHVSKSETSAVTESAVVEIQPTSTPDIAVSDTSVITESIELTIETSLSQSDSTAVTESVIVSIDGGVSDLNPSVNETTTVTESVQMLLAGDISVSDTSVITESIVLQLDQGLTVSDTTAITDTLSVDIQATTAPQISVNDTSAVAENVLVQIEAGVSVSDTSPVAESVQVLIEGAVTISDTTALAEAVQVQIGAGLAVSDTSIITDAPQMDLEGVTAVSDAVPVTEAVLVSTQATSTPQISVSDTSPVAESVQVLIEGTVTVSDTSIITESVNLESSGSIAVFDTSGITDNPVVSIGATTTPQVSVSDTSVITESVFMSGEGLVSVSDTSVVADTVEVQIQGGISVSDTSVITDTPVVDLEGVTAVSDTVPTTESVLVSIQATSTPQISVTDTTAVAEAVQTELEGAITVSDAVSNNESVEVQIQGGIAVSDTSVITESIVLQLDQSLAVSDTSAITDTPSVDIQATTAPQISVNDTSAVAENVLVQIEAGVSVSDTSVLAETVEVQIQGGISVSDTSVITESVNLESSGSIAVSDTSVITATPAVSIDATATPQVSVSDTSVITESVNVRFDQGISVTDTSTISDVPTVDVGTTTTLLIAVSDTSVASEAIQAVIDAGLSVSDTLAIAENVQAQMQAVLAVSDTSALTEAVNLQLDQYLAVSDSSNITDAPTVTIQATTTLLIAVSDTLILNDTSLLDIDVGLNASDTSVISENAQIQIEGGVAVSDTVAIADPSTVSIQATSSPQISVTDTSTSSDVPIVQIEAAADVNVAVVDSITVTDFAYLVGVGMAVASEVVTTVEDVQLQLGAGLSVSETTNVTDSPILIINSADDFGLIAADAIPVAEVVGIGLQNYALAVSETSILNDTASVSVQAAANVDVAAADSTVLTEDIGLLIEPTVRVEDAITNSESVAIMVASAADLNSSVSDPTGLAESVEAAIMTDLRVSDAAAMTDNPAVDINAASALLVSANDATAVTESASAFISAVSDLLVSTNDTANVSDQPLVTVIGVSALLVALSDTSPMTESTSADITGVGDLNAISSDVIATADLVLVTIVGISALLVAVSDSIAALDSSLLSISSLVATIAVSDAVAATDAVNLLILAATVNAGFLEFFE